ncbi:hypothetical protein A3C87_00295 [Candidatus Kaiserbacteria bacterium RIFCSPHIGHO2_02_FULL_49_34]|uniref:tRNA-dihydrouridine synthase n=1 Tax=Candidatus Kaiserbacteria bacterium RIFCSPHIGHO2_02_FULL_49_34 TaxID=1798491 RepID=A0A1F6DK91_9BACT|nr:MAG: hypothetical protein A3C87_00295 [Candidatus Kaiserbacteria bacterium RIFCSPHIGHO2_02_FULL_49_34]
MNFWKTISDAAKAKGEPLLVLAPMADVTDPSFRKVIAKYSAHERSNGTIGGPDVMWTEFVSADGLARAPEEGQKKLRADLQYAPEERPIVAQLFTANPEHMELAARLCAQMGYDGVDINMGCPDRGIEKQGCGSAMIKNPEAAKAVIEAAKRGMSFDGVERPVSVKTRIGYNHDELETWLPLLLAAKPAVITIHARTRKEMSKVPARWERVKRAVEIRNEQGSDTLIFGNGDVISREDAFAKAAATGADGVMLGRAIFGNPWLFHPEKDLTNISMDERFAALIEHTKLYEQLLPHKSFALMKKHYKAYINGFEGAVELRAQLMETTNSGEVEVIIINFQNEQKI